MEFETCRKILLSWTYIALATFPVLRFARIVNTFIRERDLRYVILLQLSEFCQVDQTVQRKHLSFFFISPIQHLIV